MNTRRKDSRMGILSLTMIPVSVIGSVAFSLIFLSAPIGIVSGIVAAKRGNKTVGIAGATINALLVVGLLAVWLWAATKKGD